MNPVYGIDPHGQMYELEPTRVERALKEGFRLATPDEVQEVLGEKAKQERQESSPWYEGPQAAAEQAARDLSFGTSDIALQAMGADPEKIHQRKEDHPWWGGLGSVVGIGGGLAAGGALGAVPKALQGAGKTGATLLRADRIGTQARTALGKIPILGKGASAVFPKAAPIAGTALEKGLNSAVGSAIEASYYALGHQLSEAVLGHPAETATDIISDLSMTAVLGGAIGASIHGIAGAAGEYSDLKRGFLEVESSAETAAKRLRHTDPRVLEQLQAIEAAREAGHIPPAEEPVTRGIIQKSIDTLKNPDLSENPHPIPEPLEPRQIQIEAHDDQAKKAWWDSQRKMNDETGAAVRHIEQAQSQYLKGNIRGDIKRSSPEGQLSTDAVQASNHLIDGFLGVYNKIKDSLRPAFKTLEKIKGIPVHLLHTVPEILESKEIFKGIGRYITETNGKIKFLKYDAGAPVTDITYKWMRQLADLVNKGENLTIGDLYGFQKNVGAAVKYDMSREQKAQLRILREVVRDYTLKLVGEVVPDLNLREAAKNYAINETNFSNLQRIVGGALEGSEEIRHSVKHEEVLDRIFRNSATINAAKKALGPELFKRARADYLMEMMGKFTNAEGTFNSRSFNTFLTDSSNRGAKGYELNSAFSEDRHFLDRLRASARLLTLVPDLPTTNPSGTAPMQMNLAVRMVKNLLNKVYGLGGKSDGISGQDLKAWNEYTANKRIAADILSHPGKSLDEAIVENEWKESFFRTLGDIERMVKKSDQIMNKQIKNIFYKDNLTSISDSLVSHRDKNSAEYKQKTFVQFSDTLKSLANDPEQLIEMMTSAVQPIHYAAPDITSQIITQTFKGLQFLNSKLPPLQKTDLFTDPGPPALSDVRTFDRYFQAVNNPMIALPLVAEGRLDMETMEALTTVYPDYLNKMRAGVFEEMAHAIQKKKKPRSAVMDSLSLFLGGSISENSQPDQVAASQQPFQASAQKRQNEQQGGAHSLSKIGVAWRINLNGSSN
jgi:hypothetical protein